VINNPFIGVCIDVMVPNSIFTYYDNIIIIIIIIIVRHLDIRDKNNGALKQFIKELVKS